MTATLTNLVERAQIKIGSVNRAAKCLENVKLCGIESRNGRQYRPAAVQQLAKLYEGEKIRLNHPSFDKVSFDRDVLDFWAVIHEPFIESDGIYAKRIEYLDTHPATPQILEAAERFPSKLGMSHNCDGHVEHVDGIDFVESIETMRGVDLVDNPATTQGLFESEQEKKTMKTTVRKIFETCLPPKDARAVVKLIEEEMPAAAEAPVEAPAEASNEDKVKAAFREMVIAAFDDDSLDSKATLAKIKEILKSQEKLLGGGDIPEDTPAEEPPAPTQESQNGQPKRDDLAELREEVAAMRRERQRQEHIGLLEAAELDVDEFKLKQLSRCENNAERKQLIESWIGSARSAGTRPVSTGSRLSESYGDGESFSDLMKNGFLGIKK